MNEVHKIDNMEFMPAIPDKYFDLAIVDPPYGIGADSFSNGENLNRADGWHRDNSTAKRLQKNRLNSGSGKLKSRMLNQSDCSWDIPPPPEYFTELFRISKNQIIWGGNYFDLPPTRCFICWDKLQPWENFSQFELAWTSFDKPARMIRLSNTGGRNKETKIHPTQKLIKLYKYLLKNYAKPGDKIFDSHVGSGSIRIACQDMGFSFEGCERAKDYWEAQEQRFQNHIKQNDLLAPEVIQNLMYQKK